MDTIYVWLPILLTMMIFGCFFGITYLLYLRWKSANYLYCSIATGSAFLLHGILFAIALKGGQQLVHTLGLLAAGLTIIGTATALLYFFHTREPKKKELIVSGAFAMLALICAIGTLFQYNGALSALMLVAVGYVVYNVLFIIRHLPRQKLYLQWMNGSFAASAILYLLSWFIHHNVVLLLANFMVTIAAASLLIIFYNRIVDMVHAVTVSAVTDGMTELFNKKHFITKVSEALQQNTAYAVIFSDIDNFKRLNDTQGHAVGDEILKLVARIMKETFQSAGYVGRYGGEEMVALVNNNKANAFELAELFRHRVEEMTPSISPVTVSVGVSLFATEGDLTPIEFIKEADLAMYKAKTSGKNRVVQYQDMEDESQLETTSLEKDTEPAIHAEQPDDTTTPMEKVLELETIEPDPVLEISDDQLMARREEFTPVAATTEAPIIHDGKLYEATQPQQIEQSQKNDESSDVVQTKAEPKAPNPFKKAIRSKTESPAHNSSKSTKGESKLANPFILPEHNDSRQVKKTDDVTLELDSQSGDNVIHPDEPLNNVETSPITDSTGADPSSEKKDDSKTSGTTEIGSFMDKIK